MIGVHAEVSNWLNNEEVVICWVYLYFVSDGRCAWLSNSSLFPHPAYDCNTCYQQKWPMFIPSVTCNHLIFIK
jgi:hypothetical protein